MTSRTADPAHLALLESLSTDEQPHSGRTLLEHLVGTRDLLVAWGNPDHVCAGGLFHSIYGTAYYRVQSASLDRRGEVAAVIGAAAEELAYLFCVTDRPAFFTEIAAAEPTLEDRVHGTSVPVSHSVLRHLIEIEVANVVEQVDPTTARPQTVERLQAMLADGEGHMSTAAHAALAAMIGAFARS
ncbi:MAG TPA: hypothetical protein VM030_09690 [Acidimicrobiales bacterium]|nr:hypothetical protein [Acidimicrobiales bacterium]